MNRLRNLRLRLRSDSESGIAMVTVIAVGAVLAMLAVAGVAFSLGTLNKARSDQDWNGALAAAYAAVEEYQSQLSNDPSYVRFGNPASTYSSYVDPAAPSVVSDVSLPAAANDAFGLGTTGAWAEVAGSEGAAHYRYEVNNSKYYTDGIITIRATGKVGDAVRSIVADLKQSGFVDYVYFTNYETNDPYNVSSNCYNYAYSGRPASCGYIQFGAADSIDGPVHSNDRIRIECGATFKSPITTGYNPASGDKYERIGSCTPNFHQGIKPTYGGVMDLPPTNSEMRKEVRFDLPTEVPVAGCLYTGPTSITFTDDGFMRVRSPWTKKTQVSASGGRDWADCGLAGTSTGRLGHSNGARVKVPNNNLIFVQNVPSVSSDPNYSASNAWDPTNTCRGTENRNALGYPVSTESAPDNAYQCRNGDIFIKGELEGKVTVAAENNLYVVDDVTYDDMERDVLGLVGQNAVIVWNPVRNKSGKTWDSTNQMYRYSGSCISGYCDSNRSVHAAILSVAHTFTVQNFDVNSSYRGDLEVLGSIAQQFRGIVRWQSGYNKDYQYDKRFRYTAPPKFLTPASTTYGVSTWVEINPVFNSDGTYR